MPTVLPTPEELARLSWRDRELAMNRARKAMHALREAENTVEAHVERLWDSTVNDWAAITRREAALILARMPADPEASQHRAEVGA